MTTMKMKKIMLKKPLKKIRNQMKTIQKRIRKVPNPMMILCEKRKTKKVKQEGLWRINQLQRQKDLSPEKESTPDLNRVLEVGLDLREKGDVILVQDLDHQIEEDQEDQELHHEKEGDLIQRGEEDLIQEGEEDLCHAKEDFHIHDPEIDHIHEGTIHALFLMTELGVVHYLDNQDL